MPLVSGFEKERAVLGKDHAAFEVPPNSASSPLPLQQESCITRDTALAVSGDR
jgi:hypothetical protein